MFGAPILGDGHSVPGPEAQELMFVTPMSF
jgi:hypothetical protein